MTGGKVREAGFFSGLRFYLAGFDEALQNQCTKNIATNGGRISKQCDSSCTHMIVSHKSLPLNDPICCAARKDGLAVVTDFWIADCVETDTLLDINNVLYRPVKDVNGIAGSEKLCICLTGYQGLARKNIMRMVEMMNAKFSKPLVGSIVTHLVCYKFEGEKYELAKKMDMELVNHYWLEDSLKSWMLLPESAYTQSGWEAENLKSRENVVEDSGTGEDDSVAPQDNAFEKRSPGAKVSPTAHVQFLTGENVNSDVDDGLKTGSKSHENSKPRDSLSPPASDGKIRRAGIVVDLITDESGDIRRLDQTSTFYRPPVEDFPVDVAVEATGNGNERSMADAEDDESTHLYEDDEHENEFSCGRSKDEDTNHKSSLLVVDMQISEPVNAVDTTCHKMEMMGFATENAGRQTSSCAEDHKCGPGSQNLDSPGIKRRRSSEFAGNEESPIEKWSGPRDEVGKNLSDVDMEENACFASARDEEPIPAQGYVKQDDLASSAGLRLSDKELPQEMGECDPKSSFSIEESAMEVSSDETDHIMCDVQSAQVPPTGSSGHVHQDGAGTAARSPNEERQGGVKTCLTRVVRKEKKQALKTNVSRNNARPKTLTKIAQSYKPQKEKGNQKKAPVAEDKENHIVNEDDQTIQRTTVKKNTAIKQALESRKTAPLEPWKMCFAVGGSTEERTNLHSIIKILGGKISKSRYQWRDGATHVILPGPLRRTEKFLAGAAAGRWILKPEYLEASRRAGKFLEEEPYEWFGQGTNDKGSISLEAPRKWRTSVASSGVGAFHGLRVLFYGECISPPLDTMKRAIKAGGGVVLATAPPYARHIADGVHFAIISPGISIEDEIVKEFLKHEVACVLSEYFVDLVCHPSSPLETHILYFTEKSALQHWMDIAQFGIGGPAQKARQTETEEDEDVSCSECGKPDVEPAMLLCGDGKGTGCGAGIHISCCKPPLEKVPDEDWLCPKCQ